jgi:hypothetical protein
MTLNEVIIKYPNLNANGFKYVGGPQEDDLHKYPLSFDAIYKWLDNIKKIKKLNEKIGSYGLKHVCEHSIKHYISNGVFIAAAIAKGFDFKRYSNGPNCIFNMSNKSISLYVDHKGGSGPCLDKQI